MIANALTANALALARLIGAVAELEILLFVFALYHLRTSLKIFMDDEELFSLFSSQ